MTQLSLTRSFYIRLLLGITLSIVAVGTFWLISSFFHLHNETDLLLHQTKQLQRKTQKEHVQIALDLIAHEREQIYKNAVSQAKNRTLEAYDMITELYQKQGQHYPQEMVKDLIVSALRNLRYNEGRGYFFALNLNGVVELYPPDPKTENTSFTDFKNSAHQQIIQKLLDIGRNDQEGSFVYHWPKPGTDKGEECAKVSYVKYFKPLNWLIGTGEYIGDIEATTQHTLIEHIEKLRFSNNTYIFVTTYDGVSLTYPAKGRNMLDVADSNGVKIVQEFIRLAKQGGGYLEYVMPALAGEQPSPKISYVAPVSDWQWYVGTGDFVANLDQEIASMLAAQKTAMKYKLAALSVTLIIFVAIGWLVSQKQKQIVAHNFNNFQNFFDRCARDHVPLDVNSQNFSEFRQLALSANLMLEERQHLEYEAQEYRDQLLNIIDAMPSIIAAVDSTGTVTLWNKYASEQTHIEPAQARGCNITELLPYLKNLFPDIVAACSDHHTFQHNLPLRQQGDSQSIRISAYPLSSNTPLQIVIRIDDITNQTRFEEMMVQTEKMMSIGGLAAGLAHEINNPLSIISQAAQNTRRRLSGSLPANRKVAEELGIDLDQLQLYLEQRNITSFLDNIAHAVDRSAEIIKNMLNFTASSASQRELCPIQQLLDNALEMAGNDYGLKKKFNFRQTMINQDIPGDLPEIRVNRIEIVQVFFNLIKNACQALAEIDEPDFVPEINLTAKVNEDNVIITFADNGPGIPEPIKLRIFEPFFTTKEIGVGTGLGLSVAYFIVVKRHYGQFLVDSTLGQGTTFTIKLPRG